MTYHVMVESRSRTPIAFSTLACPEWDAETVVERASVLGYDSIEWRGGPDGHVNPSWTTRQRADLRARMADAGISALAVTAYTEFVLTDPAQRRASVRDLIEHMQLAADLGAPFTRAFVGIADGGTLPEQVARAAEALATAADDARSLGVGIAVEQHDDFVRSERVAAVLRAVDRAEVGAVWDPGNAWSDGESPAEGIAQLGGWIRYVQLKDGSGRGDMWQLTRLGEGEVPLDAVVQSLAERGPLPPLSLEWERAWHPELDPADSALGPAQEMLRNLVRNAREEVAT
jgi:sugar phosphate isomerase/epimerase